VVVERAAWDFEPSAQLADRHAVTFML
jgi:hypothetical protein